ncbi:hypothetical protein SKAU_G00372310 [Synaphobranchus kaupii]|uniref:Uncharacterized protein n=1 Tax=Synaphobranchus kaupii TaxID=118154 RepID=A0A9Q1IF44_SYNKA|nr:hypothetical protein SKAU_G00372310 [Synaphobranchus kaupii]
MDSLPTSIGVGAEAVEMPPAINGSRKEMDDGAPPKRTAEKHGRDGFRQAARRLALTAVILALSLGPLRLLPRQSEDRGKEEKGQRPARSPNMACQILRGGE